MNQIAFPSLEPDLRETFVSDVGSIIRTVTIGDIERISKVRGVRNDYGDWASWWKSFIKGEPSISLSGSHGSLTVVDLFASAGGLTLGVQEAARAIGMRLSVQAAVDLDEDALATYATNFKPKVTLSDSVSALVDYQLSGSDVRRSFKYEPSLLRGLDGITNLDLLVGGPPCQGHSSLNNRTRGNDARNDLYLTMPAIAVASNAKSVIIENVPRVVNDQGQVVQTAKHLFEEAGYYVKMGVLSADKLGWAQTRSRHFMIASRVAEPLEISEAASRFAQPAGSLQWLIADLESAFNNGDQILDTVPNLSRDNVRRVNWLFDNDAYELVNSERPICHQDGHTYPAVYGRLHYDKPAQTLSTGFQTPGRGRHVHPSQRRVLTIREAARIQGFPDTFKYVNASGNFATRGNLQKWIGDAVPSILGYVAGLIALETLI